MSNTALSQIKGHGLAIAPQCPIYMTCSDSMTPSSDANDEKSSYKGESKAAIRPAVMAMAAS